VNRLKVLTVSVLALAGAAFSMSYASNEELKTALRKMTAQVEQAFAKKDIKFFQTSSTEDFTYISADGKKEDKKQALAGMAQMFGMSENIKANFQFGDVKANGNMGTAKVAGHITMDVKDPKGKKSKMEVHTWTVETYKKVGPKWLIQQIKETKPSMMTMNGKPMNMGAPAPPEKIKKKIG